MRGNLARDLGGAGCRGSDRGRLFARGQFARDRPAADAREGYERFLGHEAKVETNAPIDGRKRFKGPIKSVDANAVELTVDGADIRVPFPAVHKAKLVLTDALIALHQATEDNNEQEEA